MNDTKLPMANWENDSRQLPLIKRFKTERLPGNSKIKLYYQRDLALAQVYTTNVILFTTMSY